jgi:hypothetical protein
MPNKKNILNFLLLYWNYVNILITHYIENDIL